MAATLNRFHGRVMSTTESLKDTPLEEIDTLFTAII